MAFASEEMTSEQLDFGLLTDEWPDGVSADEGCPGQWRLADVEVANWGTFGGFHSLPVDRAGLLITGSSGSGKSTLLDAITTVLTPPQKRHLNAAARSGGTKGEDRTVVSYIRGAYKHEISDAGEVTNSFLRPRVATWSGILLRYENGLKSSDACGAANVANQPVNLVALFNLKANSNSTDGVSQAFAIIRGACSLSELEQYAINGIDAKRLRADYRVQVHTQHSGFAQAFCRQLGIAGAKTLELLHKTQAAKNFGSLDDLFRNFMLDEPKTFDQAKKAVEQFTALSQAHAGVVQQREQMRHLEPLVELRRQNAAACEDIARMGRLAEALPGFTAQLGIGLLEEERARLRRRGDELLELLNVAKSEQRFAKQAYEQAERALNDAGGLAMDMAELQMTTAEQHLQQVRSKRADLLVSLRCAGVDSLPSTYAEWQELRRTVEAKAAEAQERQDATRDERYRSIAQVPRLQEAIKDTKRELQHLRRQQTNIPQRLHLVREDIARQIGVSPADLPFVGELLSVKPEFAAWRGAIERLLENRAKTLLVAARNVAAVSRYVESRHLGVRLEFVSVPVDVEVPKRSFSEDSLVGRLVVKQHARHPEYSGWISRELRNRFDYACVESPDDLANHRFALTRGGQIKREMRYVKDDRFPLDDRTRWVLGDDNDEKLEQFESQLAECERALEAANREALRVGRLEQDAHDLQLANELLAKSDWTNFDERASADEHESAAAFYRQMSQGSAELQRKVELRNQAKARSVAADDAVAHAQVDHESNERALEESARQIERERGRMAALPLPQRADEEHLLELFRQVSKTFDSNKDEVYPASMKVQSRITLLQGRAQAIDQRTRNAVENIEVEYRRRWPIEAADFSVTFDDVEAYLAIYQQIKASGLPDYEQRFLHVLHDFAQDQITVIASTIRGAFREVKEKLIPVNKSLRMSAYSPVTHLQIKAKDAKGAQVGEFLDQLREITEGSWDEDDIVSAEARFAKMSAVIKRLGSSEYADKVWQHVCLDTRQHVGFIAHEIDADGAIVNVHSSDTGLSGGQKQKLVIFCLAAALRYQLADEDQPLPRFGTVVLDEAFDKADPAFARIAMDIFRVFGFHMILATPYKLVTVLEPYIGAIATTTCKNSRRSTITLIDFEVDDAEEGAGADAETAAEGAAATAVEAGEGEAAPAAERASLRGSTGGVVVGRGGGDGR